MTRFGERICLCHRHGSSHVIAWRRPLNQPYVKWKFRIINDIHFNYLIMFEISIKYGSHTVVFFSGKCHNDKMTGQVVMDKWALWNFILRWFWTHLPYCHSHSDISQVQVGLIFESWYLCFADVLFEINIPLVNRLICHLCSPNFATRP